MDVEIDKAVPRGRGRLEELYRVQVAPLQRLAFLLTGDHHLAEDLTQQAFVRFYRRFGDLRDASAAPAYLRRTVVNLARSHHRSGSREQARIEASERMNLAPPERSVEDHDLIVRALASLPYRQRAAIVLRFYEDLTEHQAADVLRCSPAAMKSLTARAMSTLRGIDMQGGNDED